MGGKKGEEEEGEEGKGVDVNTLKEYYKKG